LVSSVSSVSTFSSNPLGKLFVQEYLNRFMNDVNVAMERDTSAFKFDDTMLQSKVFIDLRRRKQIRDYLEKDFEETSFDNENENENENQNERNKKLLADAFSYVSLKGLDMLFQSSHKNLDDVQSNNFIYNYVFLRQIIAIVKYIMKESEVQAVADSIDVVDISIDGIEYHSWSDNNKRILNRVVETLYRLYKRRRDISIVSKLDLKKSFENSREERNQEKMTQHTKWDKETTDSFYMLQNRGFDNNFIERVGINIADTTEVQDKNNNDHISQSLKQDAIDQLGSMGKSRHDLFSSQGGEGYEVQGPGDESE